ncbi:unnamed protein product, partial [Chrysoparadoxa australica]
RDVREQEVTQLPLQCLKTKGYSRSAKPWSLHTSLGRNGLGGVDVSAFMYMDGRAARHRQALRRSSATSARPSPYSLGKFPHAQGTMKRSRSAARVGSRAPREVHKPATRSTPALAPAAASAPAAAAATKAGAKKAPKVKQTTKPSPAKKRRKRKSKAAPQAAPVPEASDQEVGLKVVAEASVPKHMPVLANGHLGSPSSRFSPSLQVPKGLTLWS